MNAIHSASPVRVTALAPASSPRPAARPEVAPEVSDQLSLSGMLVFPEAAPLANAKETVDNLLSQMPVPEKKVHDLSADLLLGSTNLSLPEGVSMGQGGRLLMTDFGPGTGKLPQAKVLLGDLGSSGLASGGILGSYSGARSYAVSGDVQTPFFFSDQKV